jgi:hypothetical protein
VTAECVRKDGVFLQTLVLLQQKDAREILETPRTWCRKLHR